MLNEQTLQCRPKSGKYPIYTTPVFITENFINQMFLDSWKYTGPLGDTIYRNILRIEQEPLINILCYTAIKNKTEFKKLKIYDNNNYTDGAISNILNAETNLYNTILFTKHKLTNPDWDQYLDIALSRLLTNTVRNIMVNSNVSCRLYKTENSVIILSNRETCWEIVYTAMTIALKHLYNPQNSEFIKTATFLNKNGTVEDLYQHNKNILTEFLKTSNIQNYKNKHEQNILIEFLKPNLNQYEKSIQNYKTNIKSLETQLYSAYNILNETQLNYSAASNMNVEELIKQFLEFKEKLKDVEIILSKENETTDIKLFIKRPIKQYDEKAFFKCFPRDQQNIFKPIYIDKEYNFWTVAGLCFKPNGTITTSSSLDIKTHYHCTTDTLPAYPHMHIARYNCLGTNKTEIQSFLLKKDLKTAIICAIAAVQNQNFTDITVNQTFINALYETNFKYIKCIEHVETGRMLNFEEYLQEIKGENENGEDSQN